MSNVIIGIALCGILFVMIFALCLIFAVTGFLVGYNKILAKEPKSEPPPLSDEEKAKNERLKKEAQRNYENFLNYDGFIPQEKQTI